MRLRIAGIAVALATLVACDDPVFPAVTSGVVGTGSSWSDMQTLFQAECTACHGAGSTVGGLDLETDPCGALVDAASSAYAPAVRVAPGDHASSVLWNKLADTGAYGSVMPQGGGLDPAVVDAVAKWIDDGASCSGGDTGGGGDTGTSHGYADVQAIFDAHCTACHVATGGDPDAAYLPLDAAHSYGALVDQPGTEAVDHRLRVAAGDPSHSFLLDKLEGNLAAGEGARMPEDLPPLSADDIAVIYAWIYDGAPPAVAP